MGTSNPRASGSLIPPHQPSMPKPSNQLASMPFIKMEHVNIEELLERFADMDHYVLSLLNPDASIAYEPPFITTLTGFEVEDYLGKSALDFIHPDDRPKIVGLLDRLYRDPSTWSQDPVVYRWQHKQGHWLTVHSSGVLLKHKGQVEGMLLITHDITAHRQEVKSLRKRVEELEHELELAKEVARHQLKAVTTRRVHTPVSLPALPESSRSRHRTNMIKLFDHDLRTPLHTIQGYVELLMEETSDHEGIEQELMRVHQSSQELHGLIEHLVELARYEEDDMDIQLEQVLVGAFCADFARKIDAPVEFVWNARIQRHELYTDRGKLMLTLLEQARFLMRQGVELKLRIEVTNEGGVSMCWRIAQHAISDATRSHLSQVLKQQFELDSTTWGRHYLALHLGKQRIVALGGKMSLKRLEAGTLCWENRLRPRRFGLDAESSSSHEQIRELPPRHMPNLLFVGKDAAHEARLQEWATQANLSFHATHAKEEILQMFAAPVTQTCVCLLDVLNPHFDGWNMLSELHKGRAHAHIKLIVYSVMEDVDLAKELGADDCINKLQPVAQTGARLKMLFEQADH